MDKQFERPAPLTDGAPTPSKATNGAGALAAAADENFILGLGEVRKPLREATDEELVNCEQQFRQELLGATQVIVDVTQRSDALKQLISVIFFERERRAKTILLAR